METLKQQWNKDNGDISWLVTCGLLSLRSIAWNLLPSLGRRANVVGVWGEDLKLIVNVQAKVLFPHSSVSPPRPPGVV